MTSHAQHKLWWHFDHNWSLLLNTSERRPIFMRVKEVPFKWQCSHEAQPPPLRILSWAACLANDECFLCHRSAKNKRPTKKESVLVSVHVHLILSANCYNPSPIMILIRVKCVTDVVSPPTPRKTLTWVWCLLLPSLLTHSPVAWGGKIGHSWWQVALFGLEIGLFVDSVSVYVASGHQAGWFSYQQRVCVCQKWSSNTKSSI